LDLDDGRLGDDEAPIVSSQARHLWETLSTAYQVLGLDRACGGDEVLTLLTLARVIEPTSKLDSIRVCRRPDPRRPLPSEPVAKEASSQRADR
jgi:hypothetical protein